MKYIVYLTTNVNSQINGMNRIYIGVHLTENPDIFDGYIGCGVYINLPSTYMYPKTPFLKAVKKYGTSSFKRVTLFIFDTKEEAYKKESELVNLDFIKQDHVYNACLGGDGGNYLGRTLYLFDLEGNLVKVWEYSYEAYEFYGLSRERFNYAVFDKHPLVDSLWSNSSEIDITEYKTKEDPKMTYLYSKNGKLLMEFHSRKECAEYLDLSNNTIVGAIKRNSLLKGSYYVSDKLEDIYIPKARKQYHKMTFYVYKNYEYIGEYVGKELMKVIGNYSWTQIRDRLRNLNNWIKDFYISTEKVDEIPQKKFKFAVDVYTKYGTYIETLNSIKEVKQKYNVPASKIKNIQLGDRYFKEYIFKYHSGK